MREFKTVSARDVDIIINGRKLFSVEYAELCEKTVIHRVRSVFTREDKAHVKKSREYKLNLRGLVPLYPNRSHNFSDLDNFTVSFCVDNMEYTLLGCMWDDYRFVSDREKFEEHISIAALGLRTHETGSGVLS